MPLPQNMLLGYSPKELSDLIKQSLKKDGFTVKGEIEFVVEEKHHSGMGTSNPEYQFKGANVSVSKIQYKPEYNDGGK